MKKQDTFETAEDLIVNPDFKNWVLRPTSHSILFWEKWIEANPEKKEMVYDAREFILSISYKEESLSQEDFDNSLHAIIGEQKSAPIRQKKGWSSGLSLKIAAVVSLLIVALYLGYQQSDLEFSSKETISLFYKENPKGQKSRFRLPDNTKVWLNSNSSLSYKEAEGKRIVTLSGEAFFDVFKDTSRPFEVHSNDLITSALGTSFNVLAHKEANEVEVSLITGRVLVESYQNKLLKEILSPNELVIFDRSENKLSKRQLTDRKLLAWKDGILYFNDANLQDVVETLETWFGVEVILLNETTKVWKYNGEFKNKDLKTVLSRISFVEDFDFKISENNVEIRFKK